MQIYYTKEQKLVELTNLLFVRKRNSISFESNLYEFTGLELLNLSSRLKNRIDTLAFDLKVSIVIIEYNVTAIIA